MNKPAIVGAVAGALLLGALVPAGATNAWVSTDTHALNLTSKNLSFLGAMPATSVLRVTIGLPINKSAADLYLRHITTPGDALYGRYLTPAEFTQAFGASPATAQAAATYLSRAGLTNIKVAANRTLITAQGSAAVLNRAFNTRINLYRLNGATYFANATPAMVPAALAGKIQTVTGMDSFATMHTNIVHQTLATLPQAPTRTAAIDEAGKGPNDSSSCTTIPPKGLYLNPDLFSQYGLPTPPITGVTFPTLPTQIPVSPNLCLLANVGPQGYEREYDAGTSPSGRNTNLAILAEGLLYPQVLPKDLRQFEVTNHVAQVQYTIIPTAATSTLTDTSGQDEFDLDTQYSSGVAAELKHLYVYDGPSLGDADLANEINQWAIDDITKTGSLSVGGCELLEAVDGGTELIDNALIEANVQGQSLFVSSGDEGSACALVANLGYPVGVQSVEYPASSTYSVAVGGTSTIPTTDLRYNYEVSWIGGGGGISYLEPAPVWQFNNNIPSALLDHRAVPDVAMPADPNFGGAAVIVDGAAEGVGGTSLAAPLSNGIWARLESAHGNALGLAAPAFYNVYAKYNGLGAVPTGLETSQLEGGFHDIILGSNGLYQATEGYDYNTGLGSFDISAMDKVIGQ
jgi:pseudomonalisin/xanthomonalisin